MPASRRDVLRLAGLSAVALAVPLDALSAAPASAATAPLTLTGCRAVVGTWCTIRTPSGSRRVRLVAVDDLRRPQRVPGSGEVFALRLLDGLRRRLPQGTYVVDHATLGRRSLLVVPVGTGQKYEVVVNHWAPARRP